jgi:hypothetical protein
MCLLILYTLSSVKTQLRSMCFLRKSEIVEKREIIDLKEYSLSACPRNATLRWSSFEKFFFEVDHVWIGH